jgi:undecaprenyldiphospho-muramoylpentapeptide beta-N-acetylglucosaminyltransferase
VYPALAVVSALAESAEVLWIGSEGGMEATLVKRTGIAFEAVPAGGVHGVGVRRLLPNLFRLARGLEVAKRVIRRFKPDVLFFTGGFLGVPVALAGWNLPKVVYVPDIEPALALRLISRRADVISVTAQASCEHYTKGENVVVSGYPTRPELEAIGKEEACKRLGLDSGRPIVLVFGGSRGARSINEALWGCLSDLLVKTQVVHITGELDWLRVADILPELPPLQATDYHAYKYMHEDMASALVAADLVVSRAGAATLGEYPLLGLPSVLVPYPHAWRYQKVNASYLVDHGAAVQIADDDLTSELSPTVLGLLGDPERMQAMASAARKLTMPGAARTIAAEIEKLAVGGGGAHG